MDRLKSFLTKFGCGMEERIQEAAELKERCELNQEKINNLDMITLDELIGFPIPKEHREELWKRCSTYVSMTRKELVALLLQYDWELLQMNDKTNDNIFATVFQKKEFLSIQEVVQKSIDAVLSAEHLAALKKEHSAEFVEKAMEWFRHQKEEIGISWFDDYEIRFREAMEEL